MRLLDGTAGGHLLINTTTNLGNYKLQVNGTAYASLGFFPLITTTQSSDNANFAVRSASGINGSSISQLLLEGSTNTSSRIQTRGSDTPTLSTNNIRPCDKGSLKHRDRNGSKYGFSICRRPPYRS